LDFERPSNAAERNKQKLECATVGGAGTGTFAHEAASGVRTLVFQIGTRCQRKIVCEPDPGNSEAG
jgi:hypothetical protein